jgi:hypothetical protein
VKPFRVAGSAFLWGMAGLCVAGCGPGIPGERIALTEPFSRGLDQSADRLFWHSEDAVWSMPKAGGEPQVVFSGPQIQSLRVVGDQLCWLDRAEGQWTVRCAAELGEGPPRVMATQPEEEYTVRPLATDGESLFWSTSQGRIRRVVAAGGEPVDFAQVDTDASSLAAEPGAVYASVPGGLVRFGPDGVGTPLAGGAVVVPTAVTLSSPPDDNVYWTEVGFSGRDGLVLRAPKTGGEVQLMARRQTLPSDLFVNGEHIYWATGGGSGRIRRTGVNGGREEDLASGEDVGPPVVDDEYFYWIDREGGLHRAPK